MAFPFLGKKTEALQACCIYLLETWLVMRDDKWQQSIISYKTIHSTVNKWEHFMLKVCMMLKYLHYATCKLHTIFHVNNFLWQIQGEEVAEIVLNSTTTRSVNLVRLSSRTKNIGTYKNNQYFLRISRWPHFRYDGHKSCLYHTRVFCHDACEFCAHV